MMNYNLKPKLVAIDGPVAAGKSSVGLLLAKKLGYLFFDTGIMYRAFTWKAIKQGIPLEDGEALSRLAGATKFDFVPSREGYFSPRLDGEDVSAEIMRLEVEEKVSTVSRVAGVRQAMVAAQRKLAERGGVVMAGRDIGTVVLPQAELKIFLTAPVRERAQRRYKELSERGKKVSYDTILADLRKRDDDDCRRAVSPLKPAADAVIIETNDLTLEQVVDKIYALAIKK